MADELISRQALLDDIQAAADNGGMGAVVAGTLKRYVKRSPIVDAVEVVRIQEVKQEILQIIDEFIAEYRRISESYIDHFGGKADAMETARRLVNAALTDLCGAKMDGERREENAAD